MSATDLAERPQEQTLTNGQLGKGKRLSMRAQSLMLQLADAGKTPSEIAQVLGVNCSTVTRGLDQLTDNRVLARRILDAAAPKLVKTIVDSKDAATALRALGKLDVVREDNANSGLNIAIAIGQPGQSLAPPVIQIASLSPVDNLPTALSPQAALAVSDVQHEAKATPIKGVSPASVA
jgi:DNA-binding MarR family transcriptional regulator